MRKEDEIMIDFVAHLIEHKVLDKFIKYAKVSRTQPIRADDLIIGSFDWGIGTVNWWPIHDKWLGKCGALGYMGVLV